MTTIWICGIFAKDFFTLKFFIALPTKIAIISSTYFFLLIYIMSQLDVPKTGDTIATITTNLGTITIKLFVTETPRTCANFIGLTRKGYYDGVIFHRVIRDFMIQ